MSFRLPEVVSCGKEAEAGGDGSGALPAFEPTPTPDGEARSPLLVECPLLRLNPWTSPPKRDDDEVELVEPVKEPGWNGAPPAPPPGEAGCPRGGLANPPAAPGVPLPVALPILGELGGKGILKDVPLLRRDPDPVEGPAEVDPDCCAAVAAAGYMEMGTADAAP